MSVLEQQLDGRVDAEISSICTNESRVLVTLDLGFGDIRTYPPSDSPGVIVLRPSSQDKQSVLAIANRLIMALREHPIDRELWVVDDRRIRIRS